MRTLKYTITYAMAVCINRPNPERINWW